MRISDWSSDVCSSDLGQANVAGFPRRVVHVAPGRNPIGLGQEVVDQRYPSQARGAAAARRQAALLVSVTATDPSRLGPDPRRPALPDDAAGACRSGPCCRSDRKRDVKGQSVSVSVGPEGPPIIKKIT